MHTQPADRGMKSSGIVLMLAMSVLAFAVWLKVAPELASGHRAEAAQVTKLWVDPTQGLETQVKLALVGTLLFAVFFATLLSVSMAGDDWSWQSGFTRSAARDIFTESQHWFRPPPPRF